MPTIINQIKLQFSYKRTKFLIKLNISECVHRKLYNIEKFGQKGKKLKRNSIEFHKLHPIQDNKGHILTLLEQNS